MDGVVGRGESLPAGTTQQRGVLCVLKGSEDISC